MEKWITLLFVLYVVCIIILCISLSCLIVSIIKHPEVIGQFINKILQEIY